MAKTSAGLLMYRNAVRSLQVMLVHPGGPFWARKDEGAWSIPKGEFGESEPPLDAAIREFKEETGLTPHGPFIPLGSAKQPSGKVVTVWTFEGDWDPAMLRSNVFTLEWPPKSGTKREFPEVDRAAWFETWEARRKILPGQVTFIDEVEALVTNKRNVGPWEPSQQSLFD